jgi:hypothetical protein
MKKRLNKLILILLITITCITCTNSKNNSSKEPNTEHKNMSLTDTSMLKKKLNTKSKIEVCETLGGWLNQSLDQQIVIDSIGLPDKKNQNSLWDATGTYVQQWEYKSKGITLEMESIEEISNKKVMMITIVSPCALTTSQGIGIGSDLKLIQLKYSSQIDKSASDENTIVVGSIYEGTIFTLENNKVVKIFIGASAE